MKIFNKIIPSLPGITQKKGEHAAHIPLTPYNETIAISSI